MTWTEDRAAQVRARLDAATPGPWEFADYHGDMCEGDARLITHAPEDLADALDEIDRLRAELAEARAVTNEKVKRGAAAMAAHWRDMSTGGSLDRQRDLTAHVLRAVLGGGEDA